MGLHEFLEPLAVEDALLQFEAGLEDRPGDALAVAV